MSVLLKPLSIDDLRQRIRDREGFRPKNRLSVSSLPEGLPRGRLIEITGQARVEWVLHFLAENPTLPVLWLEKTFSLLPTAFQQRGVDLSRVVFTETGDELFKIVRLALRAKAFPCVISPNDFTAEEKKLKALRLLTEKGNQTLFLLSKNPHSSWTIGFQLEVKSRLRSGSFQLQVLKDKGGT